MVLEIKKKNGESFWYSLRFGAETGTRTPDLLITNESLYQLSYFGKPAWFFVSECKGNCFFCFAQSLAEKNYLISKILCVCRDNFHCG